MTRNNPRKRRANRRKPGHHGRGAPKVSRAERRNAHGLVASTDSPESGVLDQRGVRLNRWLAERGVDSRRKCDALVQGGSVEVNGEIRLDPGYRVQPGDEIRVDGQPVREVRRLYYLFYKPRGVLCTADKRETRPRVGDLVDHLVPSRVYPAGRLDEDSEGLLLLTNDGDFAHMMMHPSFGVPKTYVVFTPMIVRQQDLEALRAGAWIDGQKVVPERVRIVRRTKAGASLEIVLREGRNREVRRLLARHGFGVKRLKRVRIGDLGVKGVRRGGLRPLTRTERDRLVAVARDERAIEGDVVFSESSISASRSRRAPIRKRRS
ncbi:MAG: rRNA pseudouridine synthase [Planctomycetes bacterium]|nr:rRNA pseudouridine synthase [Planctomycetota bacterium]